MYQAIIKANSATQLRSLLELGIDIKEHSAFQDENDYSYKVDAIPSSSSDLNCVVELALIIA